MGFINRQAHQTNLYKIPHLIDRTNKYLQLKTIPIPKAKEEIRLVIKEGKS